MIIASSKTELIVGFINSQPDWSRFAEVHRCSVNFSYLTGRNQLRTNRREGVGVQSKFVIANGPGAGKIKVRMISEIYYRSFISNGMIFDTQFSFAGKDVANVGC